MNSVSEISVAQETQPIKDNISVAKEVMEGMLGSEAVLNAKENVNTFMNAITDTIKDPNFLFSLGVGAVAGAAIGVVVAAYYEKCYEQFHGYRPVPRGIDSMVIITSSTLGFSALSAIGYKLFGG